jgi:hypothetical protein
MGDKGALSACDPALLSVCSSSSEAIWCFLVKKARNRCSQAVSIAPRVSPSTVSAALQMASTSSV